MMGRAWGRLYGGTRNHRKILALKNLLPWNWPAWYVLIDMAIECDDGGKIHVSPGLPYGDDELAKELGFRYTKSARKFLKSCEKLGLITIGNNSENNHKKRGEVRERCGREGRDCGEIMLNSFRERNYISDLSTPRVRKYREKQKMAQNHETFQKRCRNVTETDQNRRD